MISSSGEATLPGAQNLEIETFEDRIGALIREFVDSPLGGPNGGVYFSLLRSLESMKFPVNSLLAGPDGARLAAISLIADCVCMFRKWQ